MRRCILAFLTFVSAVAILSPSFANFAHAQEPSRATAPTPSTNHKAELHQALLDLTNPFTVMCVAAHPDDEDGTTLTILRRKFGVHTVSLFSTYGEGGQNAVGPELYEELGVIRARETMAAARIQGSEPYFLGLKDFGYSKSADEAFRVWGHDEALRRMVLKIRELRPDVIITNHDTTTGHGHHQATGRLILEAFDAAADPKRFPEQLGQLKPWQAQRLFVRIFGGNNKPAATDKGVAIDPNEIDPVRNSSFAEQALEALQEHATQGPWPKTLEDLMRMRGSSEGKLPLIRYQLVREAPNAPALTVAADSIPLLAGLKVADSFSYQIKPFKGQDAVLTDFLDQPVVVLESLIEWRKSNPAIEAAAQDPQRAVMMKARFDHALALATNISMTITASDEALIPASKITFTINLENKGDRSLNIDRVTFTGWDPNLQVKTADQLLPDTEATGTIEIVTPNTKRPTVPASNHLYDGLLFGKEFRARAELEVDGVHFDLPSETKLDLVPAIEILSVSPSPCVRTEEMLGHCETFELKLVSHLSIPFRGATRVEGSGGSGHNVSAELPLLLAPGETRTEKVAARSPLADRTMVQEELRRSGTIQISIVDKNKTLVTQVNVPVVYSDAHVAAGLHVGYVPSFDQTIERSLAALGVAAKALTADDIKNADLAVYSTIIIDNRGYQAHPELIANNSRLLDFVSAGGTLIVFYHKSNEWNPDPKQNRPQLAPYPILLGDERVTDETAPVKFLEPGHPLLNFPNKIKLGDFDNWIQERGLYYPKEWDNHFTALFSMNDSGEKPLTGGLLVGKYGKGNYIYTSMVWYRQLGAGVSGGYRMFANMISYGKK
ncbi:MAG: PIG-L family deacetylase [bacterium]